LASYFLMGVLVKRVYLIVFVLVTHFGPGCGQESPTSNPIQETDEVDCSGVAGGSASIDLCGKCTGGSTGVVGCVADCNGVVEGNSVEDNCGTCDEDPSNDCTQDCVGIWGGAAVLDNCGTCDDDPSNDCPRDCAGVDNGSAYLDECGNCVGGNTNEVPCEQDCAGNWGGAAVLDNCGTCDDDSSNDCPVPSGMVDVPAGAFWMGCNEVVDDECEADESPYHEVTLDSFYIDKYEVTAGQYEACVNGGACSYSGTPSSPQRTYQNGRDNHPVNYVNWSEAKAYCEWKGKRLPTEAEWEKASRSTDGRKFPWGNEAVSCSYVVMNESADVDAYGCGIGHTWAVGSKPAGASIYGAMDMSGNVWEWVNDWYFTDYYDTSPLANPPGPDVEPNSGDRRVLRGGSYDSSAGRLRSSNRNRENPSYQSGTWGFRCAQ